MLFVNAEVGFLTRMLTQILQGNFKKDQGLTAAGTSFYQQAQNLVSAIEEGVRRVIDEMSLFLGKQD